MFPQLEVVSGKGQAQTSPCLSWESLPSSSCTDPATTVGSAPPNTLKTNKKGAKKPPGHHPKLSQPLSAPHSQSKKKNFKKF